MALPDLGVSPFIDPGEIIARARAYRTAQARASHVSPEDFAILARQAMATLSDRERSDPDRILAHVSALRPVTEPSPAEARGCTARQIRKAADRVRPRTGRSPTQSLVAEELGAGESTLKRAMKDLGMPRWPPAPLDD